MKTKNPRFSVLLPTHNRADVLGFAIASVLAQTEPDFELLIVADGCTDNTCDVVASFNDPRIRFFNLPKAPHFGYANRNIALRKSCSKFIAYAAHDDLLLPDHLELMGNLLERSNASWGYSRPLWVSTDGIIVPFCTNLNLNDEYTNFMDKGNTIPAACVVHTREALEQNGFWPENITSAADWALWKRIIKDNGGNQAYLRNPTTLHFSANWRQSRHSGMNQVLTLLSIADQAEWWPQILRHPCKVEIHKQRQTEQGRIWDAMVSGQGPWIADLRAATETVIDRIAWNTIQDLHPKYESMRMSRSWLYTKPLRSINNWFRRTLLRS